MRASTGAAVVAGVALLTLVRAGAQSPRVPDARTLIQQVKTNLPKGTTLLTTLSPAGPSPAASELPTPSLKEPFEIGEALFDPGRMEPAVVSLLALMRIDVVPDAGAGAAQSGRGLALSASEVRALADMGREDLESSTDIENLPYSFADLHAAVADLLPDVSTEQMAAAYSRAYEMDPDDVVAKTLMGRPIEPEMKLTRTQIWFLLMDGFAGAAAGEARWGAADRQLPDLRPPDAQWSAAELREVLARLPLVPADRLVTINAPDVIAQGTSARPAPVNVTMRARASAAPLVSRSTGRTLIAARAGSLAGQDVTWHVGDDSALAEIGTIASPLDTPERIGANGIAQFVIQPGVAAAGGTGQLVDEWEAVEARVETRGVVAAAYAVPSPLAPLTLGTSRARVSLHLRWRSPDVLYLKIASFYSAVNFQIPGVGGGTRTGLDQVEVQLHKQGNGSYVGTGVGNVAMANQTLRGGIAGGPGACAASETQTKQALRVRATPVTECGSSADCAAAAGVLNTPPAPSPPGAATVPARASAASGFGPAHRLEDYEWWDGPRMSAQPPDGGYYRVEIFPATEPDGPENPCIPFIPAEAGRRGYGASRFMPFNDAQWTTAGQGYGIALKAGVGPTFYSDFSSMDPLGGTPLAGVKTLFELNGQTFWIVMVARTHKELIDLAQQVNALLQ